MNHVLIVDDDPAILFLMSKIVSRGGWKPLLARSGAEALELLDQAEVVVTDFSMPGMDGLELVGEIRERDPAVPVILVSGYCSETVVGWAMAAGARQCIQKPFELQQLTLAIDGAMQARRRMRPVRPGSSAA